MPPDDLTPGSVAAWRRLETNVQSYFKRVEGKSLERPLALPVGYANPPKLHKFDLGSLEHRIVIECKCLSWTKSGGTPVAKLQGANEALLYLSHAPCGFRKILVFQRFVLSGQSLADRYPVMHGHLIPPDGELMEFDAETGEMRDLTARRPC